MAPDSLYPADIQQQQICDWFGEGMYYQTIYLKTQKTITTKILHIYGWFEDTTYREI